MFLKDVFFSTDTADGFSEARFEPFIGTKGKRKKLAKILPPDKRGEVGK
jgi:hypothetical protein